MAKKLKSVMEADNEINDIEDLLKGQEPTTVRDGKDIFGESEDDDKKDDDVEVNESDDDDDEDKNDVNEAEIEDVIDASDKVLNAIGKKDSNEGTSGGDETIDEGDEFCVGDDNSDEIFEDEEADAENARNKKVSEAKKLKEAKDAKAAKKLKEAKAAKKAAKLKEAEDDDDDKDDLDESEDDDDDDDKVNESDDDEDDDKDMNESDDDDDDKDDDKVNESTLSPKELKIVMEALKIPASAKKEIKTIFEAMVKNKIKAQKSLIEAKSEKKVAKIREELIEGVDLYAKEVVTKWKAANKPVFENQVKLARLEEGFHKLGEIFKALGLESSLNESAVAAKYSTLTTKYNALLERNQKLESYVEKIHVRELYEACVSGLSKNQKRKFISLAETLEYDTVKDLKEKLDAIKKLFVEKKVYEDDELEDKTVNEESFDDEGVLSPDENDIGDNDALVSESVKLLMI